MLPRVQAVAAEDRAEKLEAELSASADQAKKLETELSASKHVSRLQRAVPLPLFTLGRSPMDARLMIQIFPSRQICFRSVLVWSA